MKAYIPMTADLFHVGHLRIIKKTAEKAKVYVGLLTDEIIKSYKGKPPIIEYKYRKEILDAIPEVHKVVKQDTLRPNLIGIDFLISGDGFEEEELNAAIEQNCEVVLMKLDGEEEMQKMFSTSNIKNRILCQKES